MTATPLRSARPARPPPQGRVAEGRHGVMPEGTGVEPYTPCLLSKAVGLSPRRDLRRAPGPPVFCAERVMPGGPLDGGLPPEGLEKCKTSRGEKLSEGWPNLSTEDL